MRHGKSAVDKILREAEQDFAQAYKDKHKPLVMKYELSLSTNFASSSLTSPSLAPNLWISFAVLEHHCQQKIRKKSPHRLGCPVFQGSLSG